MSCSPGQEAHVQALGKRIDQVVRSVSAASGPIAEARLLVMAALILTDRLTEAEKNNRPKDASTSETDSKELVALLNSLAARIEKLA